MLVRRHLSIENSACVQWVRTSVRNDLWQRDSSKSEWEGLQDDTDVWFEDGGTNKWTRGSAEDINITTRSYQIWQDYKWVHQKEELFGDKVRSSRLKWFINVYRRESGYIGQKMLNWRKRAPPLVRRDCYPAEQPQPPYSEHPLPLYPKFLVQAGTAPTQLLEPAEPEPVYARWCLSPGLWGPHSLRVSTSAGGHMSSHGLVWLKRQMICDPSIRRRKSLQHVFVCKIKALLDVSGLKLIVYSNTLFNKFYCKFPSNISHKHIM